jgi:MYXO-CTERM domain-containing protein
LQTVAGPSAVSPSAPPPRRRSRWFWWLLALLLAFVVFIILLAIPFYLRMRAQAPPTPRTAARILPLQPLPLTEPPPDRALSSISGVGIALTRKEGQIVIGSVLPGLPAARDGRIQPGDVIAKVGPSSDALQDTSGMTLEECTAAMRGPTGTRVTLFVVPAGKVAADGYTVTFTRESLSTLEKESVELARQRLEIARRRFEAGVAPRSEVLEAAGELALAEAEGDPAKEAAARLATARAALADAEARFKAGVTSANEVQRAKQRVAEAERGAASEIKNSSPTSTPGTQKP